MHKPRFDSAFYRLFFVMISIILVMQISAGLLLFKLYSTAPFKPPPGMSAALQWGAAVMIQVMPALISSWIGARMLAARSERWPSEPPSCRGISMRRPSGKSVLSRHVRPPACSTRCRPRCGGK